MTSKDELTRAFLAGYAAAMKSVMHPTYNVSDHFEQWYARECPAKLHIPHVKTREEQDEEDYLFDRYSAI